MDQPPHISPSKTPVCDANWSCEKFHIPFEQISKLSVVVVGDLLLDQYFFGTANRLCPEAPVPVVRIQTEKRCPGGAANVAVNAAQLANQVTIVGTAGISNNESESDDPGAISLKTKLKENGVEVNFIFPGDQTITKTRLIVKNRYAIRADREDRHVPLRQANLGQDEIESLVELAKKADVIIFQDYAKGTISQWLVDTLVAAANKKCFIAADPHVSSKVQWRGVDLVKPNKREAAHFSGTLLDNFVNQANGKDYLPSLGRELFKLWETEMLAVTLGEMGMALFPDRNDPCKFIFPLEQDFPVAPRQRKIAEFCGAGDTALAYLALGLAAGMHAEHCLHFATAASGLAVEQPLTAIIKPDLVVDEWTKQFQSQ